MGRGIALILATTVCFSTLDTISKLTNRYLPVNEIIWGRYLFHGIALALLVGPRLKLDLVRTAHPGTQILRGLLLMAASICFMTSLLYLPLAEASALSFISPLVMTALSVPLLGEKVRWTQWTAVALGFIGVLVIVRPGGGLFDVATLLPMGSAFFYALFQIITRKYAGRDSAYTTHFWTALVCTVLASCTLILSWKTPDLREWLALIALGIVGGGGHYLLIRAFEAAPPSTLAPFSYAQIIWSTLITWLVFDHIPDGGALVGMGIIVCAGLFAVWMQRRKMHADEEGIAPD